MGGYLMKKGNGSWVFPNQPTILTTGVVGGPFEKNGLLKDDFDFFYDDLWMGQKSYENAHRVLIEDAVQTALQKKKISPQQVQFFLSGDLINQITPSSFAARSIGIPYIGLFGACSTSMEGLALSAMIINGGGADYIVTGAASHNAAVEKQFRYPTEYGSQKPPTAQWTVTGAGYALIGTREQEVNPAPRIISATIGKVLDLGLKDPFNMGGAMAPAAVETITQHLEDLNIEPSYYDLIVTGDLGTIGRNVALELFDQRKIAIDKSMFQDCGLMIYRDGQPVQAGGSGAGCSATVLYGHLLNQMKEGTYKRILVVATGALLSPLSFQQNESIPCIAHAVAIEWI
jgi:stage V sporulation protein AD